MTSHTVDAVGVLSLAKLLGIMGLLWGLVLAVSWLVFGAPMGGRPGLPELLVVTVGGALYGVVGGAITAVVYNAAAALVGGLDLELA